MTYYAGLSYNDILDIVPKVLDYFFALRDAEGEALGINELINSYSDTHGVEFSEDAHYDLAHIVRTELDEIEAGAKATVDANAPHAKLINEAEYLGYRLLVDIEGYVTVAPLDRESFTAEVHKDYKGTWAVQTTSYGALSSQDIDMVIDGLKRAKELVNLLNEAGV